MTQWRFTDESRSVVSRLREDGGTDSMLASALPQGAEVLPPIPDEELPPVSVTMRQARLALLGVGLLDDVDAAIAAIADSNQRRAVEIEWEYAQTVDRNSPFTQQLAAGLGLDSAQLDSLFTQAAAL